MSAAVIERAVTPAELERRIKAVGDEAMLLAAAGNSKAARGKYVQMAALVAMRSRAVVERMERGRGLR